MKKVIIIMTMLIMNIVTFSETADEIVRKIDKNLAPESIEYRGKMVIHKDKKNYTKKFKIYGVGEEKSFVEFLSPARDKGTKYLTVGDNLWMYLPRANRTIKISGHMLRQSMMGSDFSYEDQTDRKKLTDLYNSKILEETSTEYILELVKKDGIETNYYKRKIWVNKENYISKKSEMYARSGKLLKILIISETKKIKDTYYPTKIKMEDKVRNDSSTEIFITEIKLDIKILDSIFTLRNLEKRN